MSRYQFYKTATWGLLVLNLLLLAIIFWPDLTPAPPPRDFGRFQGRAVRILELEDNQVPLFRQAASVHAVAMREVNNRQRDLLEPYFHSLVEPVSSREMDSLMVEIQALEREKILLTKQHFEEIGQMVGPEKREQYEEFIRAALAIVVQSHNPGPHPRKNFPPPPKDLP